MITVQPCCTHTLHTAQESATTFPPLLPYPSKLLLQIMPDGLGREEQHDVYLQLTALGSLLVSWGPPWHCSIRPSRVMECTVHCDLAPPIHEVCCRLPLECRHFPSRLNGAGSRWLHSPASSFPGVKPRHCARATRMHACMHAWPGVALPRLHSTSVRHTTQQQIASRAQIWCFKTLHWSSTVLWCFKTS